MNEKPVWRLPQDLDKLISYIENIEFRLKELEVQNLRYRIALEACAKTPPHCGICRVALEEDRASD